MKYFKQYKGRGAGFPSGSDDIKNKGLMVLKTEAVPKGGRYKYNISQVIRLHLLLDIQLVFIPQGEPGRNASVESFNALWQERMRNRHKYVQQFIPLSADPASGFLTITTMRNHIEDLLIKNMVQDISVYSETTSENPSDISQKSSDLKDITDSNGHLKLPVARGRVSFVKKG